MNAGGMRRNVAVAKVRVNGKEGFIDRINVGKGGPHSEELIAARVKELRDAGHEVEVLELFTERMPCSRSGGCRAMIADHMPGKEARPDTCAGVVRPRSGICWKPTVLVISW